MQAGLLNENIIKTLIFATVLVYTKTCLLLTKMYLILNLGLFEKKMSIT